MGKKTRVTLQDVADLAGVNRVTASVALGRSTQGGTRVSQATRLRILEAARQLDYIPNVLARALQGDRTNIIGYYAGYEMLNMASPFTAAILHGLHRSCHQYNQDLMLFGSFERDSVDSIYAALMGGKIDGLVLMPVPHSPIMDRLFQSPLPVVAIANKHPAIPSVVVDDAAGSVLLAHYLAGKGHQRVLYRTLEEPGASLQRRQKAFRCTAAGLGMSVIYSREGPAHEVTAEEEAILMEDDAKRPSAAVCWMDVSAYVLYEKCKRLSIRVPEDLAIAGFDGVQTTIPPERELTTIRAPWSDVAALAVEQLLALLNGEHLPMETVLPVQLQIGDTA